LHIKTRTALPVKLVLGKQAIEDDLPEPRLNLTMNASSNRSERLT